jgi:heme-degrading monooxygenase HmoA
MTARIWHGKTTAANFEAYTALLKKLAIPDYTKTKGFKGLTFLRNIQNDEAHFTLITYWENVEVIKNFAGADFEKAKYYPEDNNYLLEFEEKVQHYEVFAHETISS